MDSVNKIQGGKGESYPAPKIGLTGGYNSEGEDGPIIPKVIGPVHNDKIVMRNNIQTYTGVGQVPADSQEQMNTYEDILGEDLQGNTEGTGGPTEKGGPLE